MPADPSGSAAFDYLPGQRCIPLGLIDQAAELPPELHAHDGRHLARLAEMGGT